MSDTLWSTVFSLQQATLPCGWYDPSGPTPSKLIIVVFFTLGILGHTRSVVLLLREVRFWFQKQNPPDDTE